MEWFKKNCKFLLHPILFGIYPLIYLYSENFYEISLGELLKPLSLLLGITLLFLVINILIIRRVGQSTLLVSFLLYIIFTFDYFYNAFIQNVWSISQFKFLIICTSCYILYAFWVLKSNKHILRLNILFNIFIVSLFAASLFLILWTAYLNRYTDETDDLNKLRVTASDQVREDKTKRDIYYLIFDQYSRGDILKKVYDYDNSQFTESLEKRGFYIADMSYSNYPHTLHSLASSLNMDYLNYLTEQQRGKGNWSNALQVLIKHNKVCKRLVSMGYQCIDLAHFTIEGGELSEKINKEISSEVSRMLAKETTIIEIIYGKSMFPIILRDFVKKEVDKIARVNKSRISKREDILLKFSKLIEIPDYQEPTLTILHLLIPYHSPFVFDRHGNYVSLEEERSRSKTDNYVEQLKYLNNKILESIDIIIEKSDPKPIIVIQADEGTYPNGYNHIERDLTIYPAEMLRHKFAIFNAYYLPDVDNTYLYPSITPVNTFRLIFNLYLSGNYDFLPEKHYNTNYANYYRYVDIMDKIKDN